MAQRLGPRGEGGLPGGAGLVQNFLDTVEVIIVALDTEGRVALVNRKGSQILGWSVAELTGRMWFRDCLPQPEGMRDIYPYFLALMRGEVASTEYFENPVITRSGELRQIAWHNSLIRDAEGRVTAALSAGEDITDRKRMEAELADSEAFHRQLFELESDALVVSDAEDLRILDANRAAESMFGYAREELLGLSLTDLSFDPEASRAAVDRRDRRVPRRPYRRKDGSAIPVEITASYPVWKGRVVCLSAYRDITERVAMERSLERERERDALLLELHEKAAELGEAGLRELALTKAAAMTDSGFGMLRLLMESGTATPTAAILPAESSPSAEDLAAVERCVRERHPVVRDVLPADGEPAAAGRRFMAVPAISGGDVRLVIGLGEKPVPYDRTDLVHVQLLAHELDRILTKKRAEEELKDALAQKEVLLRELYHRTRNNMQLISGLLALQASRSGEERLRADYLALENRIQSMALIQDELYRTGDLSSVDMQAYAAELGEFILRSAGAPAGRIRLVVEGPGSLPVLVDSAIPCGLVLNELISNAVRHAFPDGRGGDVAVRLARDPGGEIEIEVADDGVGLGEGCDPCGEGSMGLWTVRSLVEEQLRGSLSFTGEGGFSCRFRFRDDLYQRRI